MWDAFPDRIPGSKTKFFLDAISDAVTRAEPPFPEELATHAKTSTEWMREISTLVMYLVFFVSFIL